ncbi:MAG: hypothetical protein HYU66_22250 [Armatimonadetes bacterium]|nr:hypothetical protein [Armatimonadota bacterium]
MYPDVVSVGNPFDLQRAARMQRLRPVAQLAAAPHLLSLVLRDLGGTYWAWPVRPSEAGPVLGDRIPSRNGALLLTPGVYAVVGGARQPVLPDGRDLELHAPPVRAGQPPLLSAVWPRSASPHRPLVLSARAAGAADLGVVLHVVRAGEDTPLPATTSAVFARGTRDVDARMQALTTYTAFVPPGIVNGDALHLYWSAKDAAGTVTLPEAGAAEPARVPIGDGLPITLCNFRFGALPPVRLVGAPGQRLETSGVGGSEPGRGAMLVETTGFGEQGVWVCRVPVDLSGATVEGYTSLRLRAWAVPAPGRLEVSLLDDSNGLWSTTVKLAKDWSTVVVPLAKLVQQSGRKGPVPLDRIAAVGLRAGAWLYPGERDGRRLVIVDDVALVP